MRILVLVLIIMRIAPAFAYILQGFVSPHTFWNGYFARQPTQAWGRPVYRRITDNVYMSSYGSSWYMMSSSSSPSSGSFSYYSAITFPTKPLPQTWTRSNWAGLTANDAPIVTCGCSGSAVLNPSTGACVASGAAVAVSACPPGVSVVVAFDGTLECEPCPDYMVWASETGICVCPFGYVEEASACAPAPWVQAIVLSSSENNGTDSIMNNSVWEFIDTRVTSGGVMTPVYSLLPSNRDNSGLYVKYSEGRAEWILTPSADAEDVALQTTPPRMAYFQWQNKSGSTDSPLAFPLGAPVTWIIWEAARTAFTGRSKLLFSVFAPDAEPSASASASASPSASSSSSSSSSSSATSSAAAMPPGPPEANSPSASASASASESASPVPESAQSDSHSPSASASSSSSASESSILSSSASPSASASSSSSASESSAYLAGTSTASTTSTSSSSRSSSSSNSASSSPSDSLTPSSSETPTNTQTASSSRTFSGTHSKTTTATSTKSECENAVVFQAMFRFGARADDHLGPTTYNLKALYIPV